MNIFTLLVTHSLVALWPYSKNRFRECDLGNVIHDDTFVIANAVNVRSIFFGAMKVAIYLYLFHN